MSNVATKSDIERMVRDMTVRTIVVVVLMTATLVALVGAML